jgi:predicted transposase YdaD
VHQYDTTLKTVLMRQLRGSVLAEWMGFRVTKWLPTDLPDVRTRQVDLLGRMPGGGLAHIELQSTNASDMAQRMAEYLLDIHRQHRAFARQLVLYVGEAPLRMSERLASPDFSFRCRIVDIRGLEASDLLNSPNLEDNILAVLGRLGDRRDAVQEVLKRIATATPGRRTRALAELTHLAGLRRVGGIIEMEIQKMPILLDIMDNPILGPVLRKGIAQGREEGREEGRAEALRAVVADQLVARFGSLPARARKRLQALSPTELSALSLRLLRAESLEEAFLLPPRAHASKS